MHLDTTTQTSILVNGEAVETAAGTLAELVAARGQAENEVATALNGEFVPRHVRASTPIRTGDQVEIVAPRQGG